MNNNDITMKRHCVNSVQTTAMAAVKRFFCVFFILIAFVSNVLAATETFSVSSSITAPAAGDVISHTTNVSVQYGASTTSSAISNEEIPTFSLASLDDTYYIKRSGGTKKCEVNSSGAMEGVFFALTSKVDGSLTVTLYNGHGSKALSYAIYTISNNSKTNTGSTDEIAAGSFGTHTMQVSAGVTYYFHTSGTGNMGFAGYTFTYDSNTWTSSVTGGSIPYTVHTPSSQANDQNSKPMTVVYLTNLGFDNISTVSNTDNITWLCNQGYQVIALDYGKNSNAVSPKINADIISINSSLMTGSFCNQTCSPLRSYILMEGYRIERDIPYYLDDPTVYNWPGGSYTSENAHYLYLDLVYPASPSKEVPVLVTFSHSNSYADSDLSGANIHQRMNQGNFWGKDSDSFVEGAPAVGFAWAVCDHPKYSQWGQGKYSGGANKSLASIEVNPDAARKVKAAIKTVRGKGESLGLNGAVAVTGFSRGSTAASLAVGDGDIDTFEDMTRISNSDYSEQSSKVQCAVLGPGMFDYQSANTSSNDYTRINNYVSATSGSFEQQGALATIQTKASAPTLFYHNTDDYYHEDSNGLYADQAATMKDKLDNLGVTTETITDYSSGHAVPQDEDNLTKMYNFLTTNTVVETSIPVLSVGTTEATVTNDYIYEYDNCNTENGWPTETTQLMDCVYSGGYVKFKINPSVSGDYKLTSVIATANSDRDVTISCNGKSIKKDIDNNSGWTGGKSYEWTFTDLVAGTEYEVVITCTDPNASGYQVNVWTTTIQWVETTGDDSGSTVTPGGGTFSVTDGLVDVYDENDLGLNLLSSAETFTVTGPNTSNPTYPSGSSTKDKFANGAVITYFNGYYYCMWQSSNEGEDSQDTWVAYSRSADGITWETPKVLVSDDTSNNVINTSGGWYVDKTNNKLIGYINNWTVSGWSDANVNYYGNTTTGKKIGDKQSLKTCYVSTTDGVTWTSPAEVKMSDGSTLDGIFEQDPYVTSSGRIINAAHFTSSLVPCPIYTDNVDGVTGWKKATTFDINGSGGMEPSVYQKTDGTTVMEFRTGSYCKYASASTDNGVTWTAVEATNVPDAHTKQSAGNLPDGTSYLVGTPKNEKSADVTDSNTERLLRKPLAILLSKDGTTFDTGYCLRTSDDNGGKNASGTYDGVDAAGGHAYAGLYKRPGYHYTKSMVANGYLWIAYATNKETVQVTRVPLSDISLNTVSGGTSDVSVKIDFDNRDVTTNSSYKDTSDGYQSWFIAETTKNNTTSKTFNDITFTLSHGDNSQGEKLSRTWNSTAVSGNAATDESKLINDGIYSCMSDDTYGGYGTTTERVEIDVTISGLSVGTYSLLAYHNYTFSDSHTLPTIGVEVNGVVQQTGIKQSQKVLTLAESASSLVTFEVTTEGKDIVVTYFSEPDGSTSYTRTYFLINSLELGSSVVSVGNKIQNASPVNADYHTAHDNGNVTLSWSSAANGASSHIVYFGTNEESVINGTAEMTTQTSTTLTKTGLSPLKRYYWRVDEVIDGIAYQGDVMSFQPRRLAFPSADGAGKYAVGGRGYNGNGDVYHVTNLNDTGEGSLRYGIENATGPRTIVFDVAGVITLASDLKCNKPYITVAGQTAPGIGILLRDDSYSADSEDGITRFMRFRFGHGDDWDPTSGVGNSNVGNAAGMQTNFHIMDHCMLGWGSDETFASRGAKNVSFQHNIIGESLNQNGHDKYYDTNPTVQHGYAATIGGETGSYHHNLLAHNEGRNWSMSGGLSGQTFAGKMNMYNNVVYNWHGRTTDGGTHNGNFVNNYYKMMSTAENSNTRLELFEATHEDNYQGSQEYYVAGNIRQNKDGSETEDKEGVTYVSVISSKLQEGDAGYPTYDTFASTPYDCWNVESKSVSEIESAQSAFKNVLSDVGCNYKQLDNNEKRLIEETLKGTYSKTGSRSKLLGLIDKESDSEGWGGLGMVEATRPANWDTDKDGIPAWFEIAMGWNDSAGNNNDDSDGDYYTDLEEYLNWVAVPHFYNMANDGTVTALETGTNHTITLADYFAGYTSPTYNVVSDGGATTSISNGVLTYNFPANASKLATIQVKATQDGISLTRSFNFFIDASDVEEPEEPTVTPEGTPYTLSTETYKSSTNTTTWNFTPDDLTFTVTNAKDKGYSTGNENGVKYTAGVQYTIGIPTGIQVDYITFRGYDNYSGTDAYLLELNGTEYNATDYVFPQKDSGEMYTVAEHTIQLAKPATETLTFTPAGNQVVWVITLHTSKVDVNLPDEVVNTSNTANATVEGTITWNFEGKETSEFATCGEASENIANYMSTISLAAGSGFESEYATDANWATKIIQKINNTGTNLDITNPYPVEYNGKKVYQALVRPASQVNSADENHKLTFTFNTVSGCTFQPTNVNLKMSKYITSNGDALVKLNDTNVETIEKVNSATCQPIDGNISNGADGQYSQVNEDVSVSASVDNSLYVYFYNLSKDKCAGIGDVVISGNLTYPKTTVTLDEMATVHNLDAADNVTVEMKRGLTAGAWNTFCVPFSVSKDKLQEALDGSEVEIVEYDRQEGTMLYFEDTDNIEAGKPYLIKPASFSRTYDECKTTPITFEGVDLVAADVKSNNRQVASVVCPGVADYSFVGTYVRYIMETDGTELGLNFKNKLAKPAASTNIMRGLRGFFRYNAGNGAGAKVVINGELTSIDEIEGFGTMGAEGVYHISGHFVRKGWNNGDGLQRGVYIVNGKKMVKY